MSPFFILEIPAGTKLSPEAREFVSELCYDYVQQKILLPPFPWLRLKLPASDPSFSVCALYDLRKTYMRYWYIQNNWSVVYVRDFLCSSDGHLAHELHVLEHGKRILSDDETGQRYQYWNEHGIWEAFDGCVRESLYFLLAYLNLPGSTLLRICPKRAGKSVEWVHSHSHYLIVPSAYARQLQKTRLPFTDHQLKRASHWRRAHLRRLTSSVFVHAKGRLVKVRSAWVGPKEWRGSDQKIYQVMMVDGERLS